MNWDFEIDRALTEFLIKEGKPVYDADILRYVEKTLQKAISPVTYSTHKKKLIDANIIEIIRIGRRAKYLISERAKQQHRLGILRSNLNGDIISLNNGQPHEERRLKAYFLVLYYSIRGSGRERRPESALPGFSINEILNESRRPMFPDTVFAEDEITKSVESLLKERIVNILTPFAEGGRRD